MVMSIQTNVNSLAAQRGLARAQRALDASMQRLSTGYRINKAGDDAAGLAISEKLKSQISGLNQAMRNAMDGISVLQTAEGALGELTDMLQRMRVLSVQSANDVNGDGERVSIQKEVAQLQSEITRLAESTSFNGRNLLDGTFNARQFQVGANKDEIISVTIPSGRASDFGNERFTSTNLAAENPTSSAVPAAVDLATAGPNQTDAHNITIAGAKGTTTLAIAAGETAASIASKVNNTESTTGVTAQARTSVSIANLSDAGTVAFTLGGDNTTSISANITDVNDLSELATIINARSQLTGITAETGATNGEIILTHQGGEDITIEDFQHSNAAGTETIDVTGLDFDGNASGAAVPLTHAGADSTRVGGHVDFNSTEAFQITADTANAGIVGAATAANSSALVAVADIDISDREGAQRALLTLDAAIEKIVDLRATLGAIQNRFQSTINALSSTAENLEASNSRIRDVDVAKESAELAKAQVLNQAGVSVLAQANQLPQQALKLLGQ